VASLSFLCVVSTVLSLLFCCFCSSTQPALLYLVPACLGATLVCAMARGEFAALIAFDEEEDSREEVDSEETVAKSIKAAEGVWDEALNAYINKPRGMSVGGRALLEEQKKVK